MCGVDGVKNVTYIFCMSTIFETRGKNLNVISEHTVEVHVLQKDNYVNIYVSKFRKQIIKPSSGKVWSEEVIKPLPPPLFGEKT